MANNSDLVVWKRADSDEVIRRVLTDPVGTPLPVMRSYGDAEVILAFTSAGATARSGTTLGKGTAVVCWLSESGTDRVINVTTDSVSYFNMAASTIGTSKYIKLARVGADWLCIWEECG